MENFCTYCIISLLRCWERWSGRNIKTGALLHPLQTTSNNQSNIQSNIQSNNQDNKDNGYYDELFTNYTYNTPVFQTVTVVVVD
jgi:hypothetical protein